MPVLEGNAFLLPLCVMTRSCVPWTLAASALDAFTLPLCASKWPRAFLPLAKLVFVLLPLLPHHALNNPLPALASNAAKEWVVSQ